MMNEISAKQPWSDMPWKNLRNQGGGVCLGSDSLIPLSCSAVFIAGIFLFSYAAVRYEVSALLRTEHVVTLLE